MAAERLELSVTSGGGCDDEGEAGLAGITEVRRMSPAFEMDVLNQLKVVERVATRLARYDELGTLEGGVLMPNKTIRIGVGLFLDGQQLGSDLLAERDGSPKVRDGWAEMPAAPHGKLLWHSRNRERSRSSGFLSQMPIRRRR